MEFCFFCYLTDFPFALFLPPYLFQLPLVRLLNLSSFSYSYIFSGLFRFILFPFTYISYLVTYLSVYLPNQPFISQSVSTYESIQLFTHVFSVYLLINLSMYSTHSVVRCKRYIPPPGWSPTLRSRCSVSTSPRYSGNLRFLCPEAPEVSVGGNLSWVNHNTVLGRGGKVGVWAAFRGNRKCFKEGMWRLHKFWRRRGNAFVSKIKYCCWLICEKNKILVFWQINIWCLNRYQRNEKTRCSNAMKRNKD